MSRLARLDFRSSPRKLKKSWQVAAAIELMDSGNTLPFSARYRKEKTGSLDEEQLRNIGELLGRLRALDERRETVLAAIAEQRVAEADSLTLTATASDADAPRTGRGV